jgi:hypothetical protein
MTAPPPGLAARWPGICRRCEQSYGVGDRVVYSRGEPIHCHCASGGDE